MRFIAYLRKIFTYKSLYKPMNISIKSTTINNKKTDYKNIINTTIHFNVCFVNLNYTYINHALTNLANRLHNYQTSLF